MGAALIKPLLKKNKAAGCPVLWEQAVLRGVKEESPAECVEGGQRSSLS